MSKLALAGALVATAVAHPTFSHEEFEHVGRAAPDAEMQFTAAIPVRNMDLLDETLHVISDPESPLYGQWLDREDVLNMIAPPQDARDAVYEWASSTGARCQHWPLAVRCSATAAEVEKLLDTTVTTYKHLPRNNRLVHRIAPGTAWSVPRELEGKLAFATGLIDFPTVRARNGVLHSHAHPKALDTMRSLQAASFDPSITPETLTNLYKLTGQTTSTKVSSAPAEFQADASWNATDLALFTSQMGVPYWTVPASRITGPYSPANPDTEATLDAQYMGAVSAEYIPNAYWTEEDWMYEWVNHLAATPSADIPNVFSVSWGWSESNQCYVDASGGACGTNSSSTLYVQQTNAGFAAASARGITFLISSGDAGAHGKTDNYCSTNVTLPAFPASSPYVTAIGATQLVNATAIPFTSAKSPFCQNNANVACASGGVEIVASTGTGSLITSGGGFSNVAPMPAWQANAVATYLASGAILPGPGNFNPKGRAYPDISANGHNYVITIDGSNENVDGTSCSAPVWGGIVGLLNAQRVAAGKPVLGFINPLLYKLPALNAKALTDITVGSNLCTEAGCPSSCTGFGATKGFDAATGLGTPVFTELTKVIAMLN